MDVGKTEKLPRDAEFESVGSGRYVLGAALGEGGMASVRRAHDAVLDRTVAVKVLHVDLARDPAFRERFRREAKAVGGLNHPNIVAVHDFGEDTDAGGALQFIVMEYVQGCSLRERIRERIRDGAVADVATALELTAVVLDALAYSHDNGLVHRDIKPANVMVTGEGTVKVMDFGIARALQSDATSMTRTGTVLGTPQYLSPEQAVGKPADARSDLYSVGCMLFELVTGTLPFDGESTMSVLYQHVQQPPPVPSSINPALPPAVDAIIARALCKDPERRYQSARAMADDIRRIADVETPTRPLRPQTPPAGTADAARAPLPRAAPSHSGPTRGRTRAPGATATTVAVLFVTGTLIAAGYCAWSLAPSTSPFPDTASHTPDPRATGALSDCDPSLTRGTIDTPSFTGMSPAEANSCAEIAGLKLQQNTTKGQKSDKDTVLRQEPAAYQDLKPGSTVTVWVSTGGDPRAVGDLADCEKIETHGKIFVPGFKGMTMAKARSCAEIAGLKLEEAGNIQDPATPTGQVAKQEPASDTIPTGSTVKVWISTGGDPRAVGTLSGCDDDATSDQPVAPSLVYKTIVDARACAEIAHLRLAEHTVPDEVWPAGQVIRQSPGGGQRVDAGSTIEVWVSSGRP
ncbi:PASTA domain-containing protein [Kitasatospora sp. NPDC088346]|uniref:protein kinase domain-containing protein n=1 Tax=Kitasatospora sp. NPDC088346 TaxID=3364073 RepID=UPI003812E2B7